MEISEDERCVQLMGLTADSQETRRGKEVKSRGRGKHVQ